MTVGMVRFDPAARKALSRAHEEAERAGRSNIGPGHILLGLLQDEGAAGQVLRVQGAGLDDLRRIVIDHTPASEKNAWPGPVYLLDTTRRLLELAQGITRRKQHEMILCEDLLMALLQLEDSRTSQILTAAGLDRETIRKRFDPRSQP